jgi:hypothetical protein
MTPSPPPDTRNELDMFRPRLDNILSRWHPSFVLPGKIDWNFLEKEFAPLYVEKMGWPCLPIRLLVGLHYLKGTDGDRVNAILAGCGFNFRKLPRRFLSLVFGLVFVHRFEPEDRFLPLSVGFTAA